MHQGSVRMVVGLSVVLTHIFAFATIMFFKSVYMSMTQRIDVALLLLPVTATYFMAVVKSAVERQTDMDPGRPVNINFVVVVFLVTGAFLLAVVAIVIEMPGPFAPTIDDAKKWLVGLQVGLGGSFGYIATDLFGKVETVVAPPAQAA